MSPEPRTPVLVGAGQVVSRPEDSGSVTERPEPVDMMATALLEAASNSAGAAGRRLLERAESLRILPPLSWSYANPGILVAERLGISPSEIAVAGISGNGPQSVANRTATAISAGRIEIALVAGADCIGTRVSARRDPDHPALSWTRQPAGTLEPVHLDTEIAPVTAAEMSAQMDRPLRVFPLFATSLRHANGRSIEEDAVFVSRVWSRFSDVAACNPYAWSRQPKSPEEIRTISAQNRWAAFPYSKLEVANDRFDLGAAFIMCSLGAARAAGVRDDDMVFPVSGSDANDHWYVTHRMNLHSSPAIRLTSERALSLAGAGLDDVEHIDLYSCFPCAVQIAASEIGLPIADPKRPLTITGGLGFAGGPGNNYVSHSIATLARILREQGGTGLVTGLGWYATKHSVGIWSSTPPASPFRSESVQAEVDALPQRPPAPNDGDGTTGEVESYTVMVGRGGIPDLGIFAILTREGSRAWATSVDPDLLGGMMKEEGCGRKARVRPDGRIDVR